MIMKVTGNEDVAMPALGFSVFQAPPDQIVAHVEARHRDIPEA